MIDKRTGDISIPFENFIIHKDLKENELENSRFSKAFLREKNDMGTGYIWHYFSPVLIMKRDIIFWLCFYYGNLFSVNFCISSMDLPTSWSNWSEEGELKRQLLNEEFLSEIFGYSFKQYHFSWGNIASIYDPRSGSSYVNLSYTNN